MLLSVRIKWLLGSYVTLPNNHDKGYWMGGRNVTFQLNVYTVAISFATKIVINEWLPLNKTGFLMHSELFPGQTRLTARPKFRVFAKKRVRKVRSFSNSEVFFLHIDNASGP